MPANAAKIAKVLKFGGTSVGTSERLGKVSDIIIKSQQSTPIAVCVSAMSGTTKKEGTTSRLLLCLDYATQGNRQGIQEETEGIKQFHQKIIQETIKDQKIKDELLLYIQEEMQSLSNFLEALVEIEEVSIRSRDRVIAVGEILSARILTSVVNDKAKKDTALFLNLNQIMDESWQDADNAFFQELEKRLGALMVQSAVSKPILILTGYIGRIPGGIVEKIGRGYTDFTASLAAAGSGAQGLEIWKEVDGIFSTDPRKVANAHVVPHISYQEAAELTFFGTEAIHPRTMAPCIRKQIPILVKNVLNPGGEGTLVDQEKKPSHRGIGKALTQKSDIAIISIQSDRMNEAPGFIYKMGEIFFRNGVSIDLMATSEVSVSITVSNTDKATLDNLVHELHKIGDVSLMQNLTSISIIGHGMQNHIGVAGKIFSCMGNNKINIVLISQGASELSISFVVKADDAQNAINALHREFLED